MWIDRVAGENPKNAHGVVIDSPSYALPPGVNTLTSGQGFDIGELQNVPRR
jgi:hypothetical protein